MSGHARLLRELAPSVLAAVVRRFGDFAAAEDAVQEALLAASQRWQKYGEPRDPKAWLITVASRRLADEWRSASARRRRELTVVEQVAGLSHDSSDWSASGTGPDDDTLVLLFMCCHPVLGRSAAIALTLRAVAGLTTAQIAHAFLVPLATMGQRISRAKQTLRTHGVVFSRPEASEWPSRLDAVLHTLYLLFNEGYTTSTGSSLDRADLATEAIRLTRLLHERLPEHTETAGLLALMLLNDARRSARTGPQGQLVPLDEQDRSRWNRAQIDLGVALLTATLSRGAVGPYQVQAAIAAVHDEAPCIDQTDWAQILALYELLARMSNNPLVTLNRAVAAAMVHGPATGLDLVAALDNDPRLAQHHRLAAVRGHLHEMAGDRHAAISCYRTAASRTSSVPERDYLLRKAAELESR